MNEFLRNLPHTGSIALIAKADESKLVEAQIRVPLIYGGSWWLHCFLLYDELEASIGAREIERLLACESPRGDEP